MPEITWSAKYDDGSILGPPASADEIDRQRVIEFSLLVPPNPRPVFTLHLDPGQRLIYRRRVNLPAGGKPRVCHLLGWQQNVSGKSVQSILYVFEDGPIHLAGRFREDHPWFYAPVLRPSEKDM